MHATKNYLPAPLQLAILLDESKGPDSMPMHPERIKIDQSCKQYWTIADSACTETGRLRTLQWLDVLRSE
jgi:hypothetical protein